MLVYAGRARLARARMVRLDMVSPAARTGLHGRCPSRKEQRLGAVAQLGERCNRTAEVGGSNPLSSTNNINALRFRKQNWGRA
jgi:hypothetical protein